MNKLRPVIQRRLAAILCADVAGYARLMSLDETSALSLLNSHREIIDRQISRYDGRTANTAGDSIVAEFPSSINAVRCALDIQERLAEANDDIPPERRVIFRIGVHVGEIMIKDGDLFGDGVNIAARMEKLVSSDTEIYEIRRHPVLRRLKREPAGEPPPDPAGDSCAP
jgi:adenylate cyclase